MPIARAICLGEIVIDCFAEQLGLARDEVANWTLLPGGAPVNAACAIVKLGGQADFIGAVGSDPWGDALVNLLRDMKVGSEGVQRRKKAPTRQLYMTFDAEGNRTFAGFSESDPTVFADAHLFADAIDPMLFADASFLVLGTLPLAYEDTRQAVERAISLAAAQDLSIFIDVNWQPMFWQRPAEAPGRIYDLIKKAQFLKVSSEESEWLFGTVSPVAIARQFSHLKGVLVIAESRDVGYWLMGNSGSLPAFDTDVEDLMGADDAFTAGFVYQLLEKGITCLREAAGARRVVSYASAVGALTTTRPGAIAALPTPKEVEVFLYLNADNYQREF